MPDLYIITGSNGAGKSSVGGNYLPQYIRETCEVFDGDKLFMQKQKLLWKQGITAIKEARNIAYYFVKDTFDLENSAVVNAGDYSQMPDWFINFLPSIYQLVLKR